MSQEVLVDISIGKVMPDDFVKQLDWSTKTILVIENDEATYLMISEYLRDTNAKFIHIQQKDALTFVPKSKISLIIYNLSYTEVQSGFELTKKLKLKYKDIPFIACSACFFKVNDIKDYYSIGYNEFISKPIDFRLLANILTTYL